MSELALKRAKAGRPSRLKNADPWTEAELKALRLLVKQGVSRKQMIRILGRTPESINAQIDGASAQRNTQPISLGGPVWSRPRRSQA